MNHESYGKRSMRGGLVLTLLVAAGAACGDDDDDGEAAATTDAGNVGDAGTTPDATTPGAGDSVDEATLAKCPQTSTLIETTEWTSCLSGKRLTGSEPFNNTPCELRVGANGAFEYLRDGALAIAVPERSAWRGASGTYQNEGSGGRRIFLAGIAPDLAPVEGQARVTNVDISIFPLASQQDTVAIRYLDAALARQTYNCTLDAP